MLIKCFLLTFFQSSNWLSRLVFSANWVISWRLINSYLNRLVSYNKIIKIWTYITPATKMSILCQNLNPLKRYMIWSLRPLKKRRCLQSLCQWGLFPQSQIRKNPFPPYHAREKVLHSNYNHKPTHLKTTVTPITCYHDMPGDKLPYWVLLRAK